MAHSSTQTRSVCDLLDERAHAQGDDLAYVFLDGEEERSCDSTSSLIFGVFESFRRTGANRKDEKERR